jgi:hypothetical protein
MISRQYNVLTVHDGQIARLVPEKEPGSFGVIIPSDYVGKVLPLWRFFISANPA